MPASTELCQQPDSAQADQAIVKQLGRCDYQRVLHDMHTFTNERDAHTQDQIWLVEHDAVFTQGQAGKEQHILAAGEIPVVQSDRGGQVTYHGPGQLVVYFLVDLRRKSLNVRQLVSIIEQIVIDTAAHFSVQAQARADAPGVYVNDKKLCSLGLRIRKGCSFHGLALNVAMDLSPFLRINPCGFAQMQMTQLSDYGDYTLEDVTPILLQHVQKQLHYQCLTYV